MDASSKVRAIALALLTTILFGFTAQSVAESDSGDEGLIKQGTAAVRESRFDEAFRIFLPLAERGNRTAQSMIASMYRKGEGVAKDEAQAVAWYRKAAEQGDVDAQFFLGLMHEFGRGVAKDEVQAVAWYRKAAEQGVASAQFLLGVMYADGRGVAKDEAQAVAWYRKAAEQFDARAQLNLGVMYLDGRGVAKDEAQAVAWYRKAAEQGHASAQFNLGVMYANGRGVAKDEAQAVAWYRKAAEQGHASAQNNLGVMYANGQGVERNYAWAAYWYAKAAQQGNTLAIENIPSNLERLVELKTKGAANIREKPTADAPKLATVPAGSSLYRLETLDGWYGVYIKTDHAIGYVASSLVYQVPDSAFQGSASRAGSNASNDGWPARPAKRPGVVSCNTSCNNGDCKRTYDDGRKVRFQARQTFNPMTSQWEYDAGGC